MRAAGYSKNGPAADVLEVVELPTPVPADGEVLVRVAVSGVNPSDVKARAGRPLNGDFQIPHSDGAGVIEAVGEGVDKARIGERVWLWNGAWQRGSGTCAEYIALPAAQAVPIPDGIDNDTGACLGIPGLTAMHGINLVKEAGAKSILITGAASSVGHYACQIAKHAGLKVIGTASERRHATAEEAGCDAVIDYRGDAVANAIRSANDGPVDAILDMDFSSTAGLVADGVLAEHGNWFCYGSNDMGQLSFDFRSALFNSLKFSFFLVYQLSNEERFAAITGLLSILEAGALTTRIDQQFSLNDIIEAHQRVESGDATGNIVVTM
jgi:NADPH:quinone reductase